MRLQAEIKDLEVKEDASIAAAIAASGKNGGDHQPAMKRMHAKYKVARDPMPFSSSPPVPR